MRDYCIEMSLWQGRGGVILRRLVFSVEVAFKLLLSPSRFSPCVVGASLLFALENRIGGAGVFWGLPLSAQTENRLTAGSVRYTSHVLF